MRVPNDIRRKAHLVIKPFVIVNVHYTCATPTSLMSPRPQLERCICAGRLSCVRALGWIVWCSWVYNTLRILWYVNLHRVPDALR